MDRIIIHVCLAVAAIVGTAVTGEADTFSLTGRYEGLYACDSTTASVPSSWARPMSAAIIQNGDNFAMEVTYTDTDENPGTEYSLYTGNTAVSKDNKLTSGYFEACGGTFPSKELARIFPSATNTSGFSVTVDSVWASDKVPNLPGLTVQSCRWSLTRVSTETPEVRKCE